MNILEHIKSLEDNDVLDELFFGKICPQDKCDKFQTKEYSSLKMDLRDTEERLREKLGNEEEWQLDKLMDIQAEISATEGLYNFTNGCRLGAQLLVHLLLVPYNK